MHTPGSSVAGYGLLLVVQIVFVIVFGFFTDYSKELLPKNGTSTMEASHGVAEEKYLPKYPRECEKICVRNYVTKDAGVIALQ